MFCACHLARLVAIILNGRCFTLVDIFNLQRQKVAVLENAHNIPEKEILNGVSEFSFKLPAADDKNKFCQPLYYARPHGGKQLYRILDNEKNNTNNTPIKTYACEHVIATLIDSLPFYGFQIDNMNTRTVLLEILKMQTTENWVLGDCDFSRLFSYGWSRENLLTMVFGVPKVFSANYKWIFDTSTYPWIMHLKILDESINPEFYIREEKNLISSTSKTKGSNICTRLYASGFGEGVNQLTFADINNGLPYVENPEAIEKYGLIERSWEDRRFEIAENLLERARVLLDGLSKPYETYTCSVADLEKMTGMETDRAEAGKIVKWGDLVTYIKTVNRVHDAVGQDTIEIANSPEDIAGTIADLADKQRVEQVYAQGNTFLYPVTFNDNADATHPATLQLYVPNEAKIINQVMLSVIIEPFRSYGRSAKSGGGSTETSGASSETTTGTMPVEAIYIPESIGTGKPYPTDVSGYSTHYHSWTFNWRDEFLRHGHDMEHTHKTTSPSHTHDIEHGIYEGSRATTLTLEIENNKYPLGDQTVIDITEYLGKDNAGNIRRGTFHTIKIYPDALTRIVVNITGQMFLVGLSGGRF